MKTYFSPGLILVSIFLLTAGGCADKPLSVPPMAGEGGNSGGSISSGSVSGGIQERGVGAGETGGKGGSFADGGGPSSGSGNSSGGMGDFHSGPLTGDDTVKGQLGGGSSGGATSPQVASLVPFHTNPNLTDIFFAYDRHDLNDESKSVLRKNADWLKSNPNVSIQIQGHCDERGTNNYNLALGQRRAQSAKNFLVSLGVAGKRINAMTYGEEKPFCVARNEDCWSQNRRGHFMATK